MKKVSKKEPSKGFPREKTVDNLWEIIKIPVFILGVYTILMTFIEFNVNNFNSSLVYSLSVISIVVTLSCFFYVGYQSVKKLNNANFAIKAGAYTGGIVGLIGAVLGIFLIYAFPSYYNETISEIVKLGYSKESVLILLKIISWINILFSTAFQALIGALFSWIGALIFKKFFINRN